jgi:hypothetical protein
MMGILVGIVAAVVIGGIASDWHPDVGGALGITILIYVLGGLGFVVGLFGSFICVFKTLRATSKAMT